MWFPNVILCTDTISPLFKPVTVMFATVSDIEHSGANNEPS